MSAKSSAKLVLAIVSALVPSAGWGAGNGAGAGGAGAQRAINSGLPPGEPGPPGSVNNRGGPPPKPMGVHGSPRYEPGMSSGK